LFCRTAESWIRGFDYDNGVEDQLLVLVRQPKVSRRSPIDRNGNTICVQRTTDPIDAGGRHWLPYSVDLGARFKM